MKVIGRYEIEEKLGEGGMGVVYRARDPLLDRVIALKLISTSVEGNPELRERFFREARAAGQLSHRSVITIHDLGEHEGQPYLAMEFLKGQDLQRWLSKGLIMSLGRKVQLAIDLCEGLEYAHARGVIHRDIKPANIFITEDGAVKLLDFGLARLVTSEMTHSNTMMGTLNYMAPEQVRGERADHRSDVFSMGVVLYELLGGRKAFEGDSFAATLYKILQDVPEPLYNLDATLPLEIVAIVDRAIEKTREERYQHMGEMLRDLMLLRQQLGFQTSPLTGVSVSGELAAQSGVRSPAHGTPSSRPRSGQPLGQPPAPTMTGTTPQPISPGSTPPAAPPPRRLSLPFAAGIAAVVVLGSLGAWLILRSPPDAPTAPAQSAAPDPAVIETSVQRADLLLRAGDFDAARREADAILAKAPNHAEARRIRERAQETVDSIESGLREARAHYDAGRYEEAARTAGNVLALAPANADARRLMEESSARTRVTSAEDVRARGRLADDARERMAQAKSAAIAARAPALAPAAYGAATKAEQEAQRLLKAGRPGDAMVKFYEANGLFRSADVSARTEAAAQQARAGQPDATPPPVAAPGPTPPVPPAPKPAGPEARVGPPTLPGSQAAERPVLPPSPAPVPAPQPSAPQGRSTQGPAGLPPAAHPPEAVPPEQQIREVLGRYESALESRDLDELQRIWPGLGGAQQTAISNDFRNASRIDVEIVGAQIAVTGTTATATFLRRYEVVTVEGQRLATDTRTTMVLRRDRERWVIQDIRFEPARRLPQAAPLD